VRDALLGPGINFLPAEPHKPAKLQEREFFPKDHGSNFGGFDVQVAGEFFDREEWGGTMAWFVIGRTPLFFVDENG
jgi:hypothetical protein